MQNAKIYAMQKINKSSLRFSIIYNSAFLALFSVYPQVSAYNWPLWVMFLSFSFCSFYLTWKYCEQCAVGMRWFADDELIFWVKMKIELPKRNNNNNDNIRRKMKECNIMKDRKRNYYEQEMVKATIVELEPFSFFGLDVWLLYRCVCV